jgi:uncharacterized protein (TIGR00661 family)
MNRSKVLFGVCGIGLGHTHRQLPIIEHCVRSCEVGIFAYGESLGVFSRRFADTPNVLVERVAVPFYVGHTRGLDFAATARLESNREDYLRINCAAMARAAERMGTPDLVVSDYEPVSAQYAYASGAPLVTIDQQSKYLCGDFPETIGGTQAADEAMRLRMFFPRADRRLACSFFAVSRRAESCEEVEVCPPILSETIARERGRPRSGRPLVVVYLSSQRPFGQGLDEIAEILSSQPAVEFHLFCRSAHRSASGNLIIHEHGDPEFTSILLAATGSSAPPATRCCPRRCTSEYRSMRCRSPYTSSSSTRAQWRTMASVPRAPASRGLGWQASCWRSIPVEQR